MSNRISRLFTNRESSKSKKDFMESVADNSNTPSEILLKLSKCRDKTIRKKVASNENTPHMALKRMSKDKDNSVRACVAGHPNTPHTILTRLSKDKDNSVRNMVTLNSSTPIDMLTELSKNQKDETTRMFVAMNTNTPVQILSKLTEDDNWRVRLAVALNLNTLPIDLIKLMQDGYCDVIITATENPNMPITLKLLFNESDTIRTNITENEKIADQLKSLQITAPLISDEFIAKTPIEEIFDNFKNKVAITEILFAAVESNLCYDMESFNEAYYAVTEENMLPYIAAGIYGTPIETEQ